MISAKQLVDSIRAAGGSVQLDGEKLLFTAPKTWAYPHRQVALAELRDQKQEVMAYLVSQEPHESREDVISACGATYCAGCYEISPGQHIHPPRGRTL
jgi:hypothetical protein